jgi:hypothetical protein
MLKRWTFSLITRNANDVMMEIHNSGDNKGRMPLFLPFDMSMKFLNDELSPEEYQEILHFEMPSEEMNFHPVFTIRSAKERPDQLAKNEFWEWEKLPPLSIHQ